MAVACRGSRTRGTQAVPGSPLDLRRTRVRRPRASTQATRACVLQEREILEKAAAVQRKPEPGLVHHSDQGSQGGFNRSSQRSIEGGCDRHEENGGGSGWAVGDALSGPFADGRLGHRQRSLGREGRRAWTRRPRRACRRWSASGGFGRVAGCRPSLSQRRRDGPCHSPSRRDRDPARPRRWGARDRASARSLAVDDLEGASSQRRDPRRRVRVSRHDGAVACRSARHPKPRSSP